MHTKAAVNKVLIKCCKMQVNHRHIRWNAVSRIFLLQYCEATQTAVRKSIKAYAPQHKSKDLSKWKFAARVEESSKCSYSLLTYRQQPPFRLIFYWETYVKTCCCNWFASEMWSKKKKSNLSVLNESKSTPCHSAPSLLLRPFISLLMTHLKFWSKDTFRKFL